MVNELPKVLRDNIIIIQHSNGKRYIAQTLNIPVSTTVQRWKVHGTATNHPWICTPCTIAQHALEPIIIKVREKPWAT